MRAAHVLVAVLNVDEGRARLVGSARDLARERRVLDERVDSQHLAGLQVQADVDGELRVLAETVLCGGHGARTIATRVDLSAGRSAP